MRVVIQDDYEKMCKWAADYIADKINVKIKLTDLGQGEYEDKCNLAIANGEANLFWTASWMGSVSTDNLVSGKAAYDLSELLPGTDLYNSFKDVNSNAFTKVQNGKYQDDGRAQGNGY